MTVPHLQADEMVGEDYHDGDHRLLGRMFYNRSQGYYAEPSGTVLNGNNVTGATLLVEGTPSNADDSTGPFVRWTSAAVLNSDAGIGISAGLNKFARASWSAEVRCNMKLGATLTAVRHWIGIVSADPMAAADPALSMAAFRYDTSVDGTLFWRTYTNDGVGTGTVTALSAGAPSNVGAIVASRKYDLRIKVEALQGAAPNKVMFFIDDLLVATHSANLPVAATYLAPWAQVRTLDAVAKTIDLNQFIYNSQPIY